MRQRLGMLGLLWVCLGVTAVSPVVAAEPPSPRSFLLRYYYRFDTVHGFDEQEVLVFRDGLVIAISKGNFEGRPFTLFRRSQTLPEDFERLTMALAMYKVGQRIGNCNSYLAPRPEETFTWFGKGHRQNTILAGTRFAEPCSRETEDLLLELVSFVLNVGSGETEFAELRQ